MENFTYCIPTKIYFGKGQIEKLRDIVSEYGKKVLLVYGGGSIKKIGLYDAVKRIVNDCGGSMTELCGVDPNPRIESVREGVRLCRENDIQLVLAVGGGSVLDCAKVVAAGAAYDGDAWDLVINPKKITKVLPIATILTLAATGSEMDVFAVISNMETNDKIGTAHEKLRPVASIMDPRFTFSVSKYQTAAGTADILSHLFEGYFGTEDSAYLQNRCAEGVIKTVLHYGLKAMENPEDYDARANLMWASSWAINGFLEAGKIHGWTVHPLEHQLSAYYDITHGVGLAILTPHWMRYILCDDTAGKFAEYGRNVWGIGGDRTDMEIALEAIALTEKYFHGLGIPKTLTELGIDETYFDEMAQKAHDGLSHPYVDLTKEDIIEIYRRAL